MFIGRRKRAFETPLDRWFRSELSGYVREMLLSPNSACLMYFRTEAIEAMLTEHRSGRQDHQRLLFSLLTFELWHRQFVGCLEQYPHWMLSMSSQPIGTS